MWDRRHETGYMRQEMWDQGWEFAHSLIAHSLILSFRSNQMSTVSDALRSLKTNKWPWVNRSGCSEEMSDRERFAQVAQRKWSMWANRSFRSPKMSKWAISKIWLKKSKILFCYVLFKLKKQKNFWKNERIVYFLFFEWIAQWQKRSVSLGNQMSEFPALPLPLFRRGETHHTHKLYYLLSSLF